MTRERILRAVLRVIAAEGVAGVTNRRIAREAEVSLGSITYHFATQSDLLRESLLLFVHEETTRLAALAQQPATVEQAAVLVQQVIESLPSELAPFELYLQAARDPSLRDAASRCFAAYDALALTVLKALGLPNPEPLTAPVVALVAGMQLRRLATGTTPEIAAALLLLVSASPN